MAETRARVGPLHFVLLFHQYSVLCPAAEAPRDLRDGHDPATLRHRHTAYRTLVGASPSEEQITNRPGRLEPTQREHWFSSFHCVLFPIVFLSIIHPNQSHHLRFILATRTPTPDPTPTDTAPNTCTHRAASRPAARRRPRRLLSGDRNGSTSREKRTWRAAAGAGTRSRRRPSSGKSSQGRARRVSRYVKRQPQLGWSGPLGP